MATLLTINGGSSSLKFAAFSTGAELRRQISGSVERIGGSGATFQVADSRGRPEASLEIGAVDHTFAFDGWWFSIQ